MKSALYLVRIRGAGEFAQMHDDLGSMPDINRPRLRSRTASSSGIHW